MNKPSTDNIFKKTNVEPVPRTALSISETALSIGVSERTIYRMISEGELPIVQIGKRRLISIDILKKWLSERTKMDPQIDKNP